LTLDLIKSSLARVWGAVQAVALDAALGRAAALATVASAWVASVLAAARAYQCRHWIVSCVHF
jgi:hypothetical protein